MENKEQLEQEKAKYTRLKNLTEQSGWQDFIDIFHEEYEDAFNKLKSPNYVKQEHESRGLIKGLERIMNRINSDMAFGEEAKRKYVKKYLNMQEE